MKKATILILSFFIVFTLGTLAEDAVFQSYHHAQQAINGKPLPPITEWTFHTFAIWQNGAIACIFLIPWSAFLFETVYSLRHSPTPRNHYRFVFSFVIFFLAETLLTIWAALICLLPFYGRFLILVADPAPISSYIPHFIFCILLLLTLIFAIIAIRRTFFSNSTHVA